MTRLRFLFALLGCLAIVLAGLPTVALAWTQPHHVDGATAAPCSQDCPSCEGAPCEPQAVGCTVACVSVTPALGVAAFVLSVPPSEAASWQRDFKTLHGLSPPPDPSPPRS